MTTPLRLGIAGLGTVGAGVLKIVRQKGALLAARAGREIAVTAVSARSRSNAAALPLFDLRLRGRHPGLAPPPPFARCRRASSELMGGATARPSPRDPQRAPSSRGKAG